MGPSRSFSPGEVPYHGLLVAPYISFRAWEGGGAVLWSGLRNSTVGMWNAGSLIPRLGSHSGSQLILAKQTAFFSSPSLLLVFLCQFSVKFQCSLLDNYSKCNCLYTILVLLSGAGEHKIILDCHLEAEILIF